MSATGKLIIPVFIPHGGCPHRCVFCNQNGITGKDTPPAPEEVRGRLYDRLGPDTSEASIAFYGGSFTCMPVELQKDYLGAAREFVLKGYAAGIRLSTRPDCMDGAVAGFLRSEGVTTVELGAQSMDDAVLRASGRGHTAADTASAAHAVRGAGIVIGIQIMAGLPCDTAQGFIRTVHEVIDLEPSFVRIYPALVVRGAPLERLHARGEYRPLALEEAVSLCAEACGLFEAAGIRVIRTGLQPTEELEAALVAGPYHPAFGHLVGSEMALRRMVSLIKADFGDAIPEDMEFCVNPAELSKYLGIKKMNLEKLREMFGLPVSVRADAAVDRGVLLLA